MVQGDAELFPGLNAGVYTAVFMYLCRLNAGVYTGGRLGPLQIVAQYLKLHLYHQVF